MAKTKTLRKESIFSLKNIVVTGLIIFYAVFLVIPIIMAFVGSFHKWNPLKGDFIYTGFENYTRVFTNDLFWSSLSNTLIFTIVVIFFRIVIGLGIALILYSSIVKGKTFFRAAFYMPVVTPLVAVSFVWVWMYNPQMGLINQILGTNINWLLNKDTALGSVIAMTIWKDYGYAVVLFLAGLYGLPKDCYEAAEIDGASGFSLFRYITLPLLKPMTLFVVITSIISYLQTYIQILVMTEGGPGTSTYVTSYLIFDEAFVKYNFGYASAISFVMFIVIAIFTVFAFKITSDKEKGGAK
ncbi:ABC transporter permease [Vallitalea longa]|uniref:ABC transporter permease n=1 Tax=Vallitalea longa TaxID=2936439 RepID=A0A9W6DG04_9FIRM|nr:sugar ABC transporter permease [Vallitalea longa]GKX29254.1 ABC transporter permease [Vallitalea longa]